MAHTAGRGRRLRDVAGGGARAGAARVACLLRGVPAPPRAVGRGRRQLHRCGRPCAGGRLRRAAAARPRVLARLVARRPAAAGRPAGARDPGGPSIGAALPRSRGPRRGDAHGARSGAGRAAAHPKAPRGCPRRVRLPFRRARRERGGARRPRGRGNLADRRGGASKRARALPAEAPRAPRGAARIPLRFAGAARAGAAAHGARAPERPGKGRGRAAAGARLRVRGGERLVAKRSGCLRAPRGGRGARAAGGAAVPGRRHRAARVAGVLGGRVRRKAGDAGGGPGVAACRRGLARGPDRHRRSAAATAAARAALVRAARLRCRGRGGADRGDPGALGASRHAGAAARARAIRIA